MAGNNTKTLVRMANQMADFFKPYAHDDAVAGVQNHILKFWSPVMRRDLGAHIEHGGEGLRPEVVKAFKKLSQTRSTAPRAADI